MNLNETINLIIATVAILGFITTNIWTSNEITELKKSNEILQDELSLLHKEVYKEPNMELILPRGYVSVYTGPNEDMGATETPMKISRNNTNNTLNTTLTVVNTGYKPLILSFMSIHIFCTNNSFAGVGSIEINKVLKVDDTLDIPFNYWLSPSIGTEKCNLTFILYSKNDITTNGTMTIEIIP